MQAAGPSHTITISGTSPGQLDHSQTSRLLSSPGSRLTFAAFNPKTASPDTRKLSAKDELCSQRRVVIETLPNGENFWRWVPRAKGEGAGGEGAGGERSWPRVINICGQLVQCSRDQWDIYKLDPMYECTVRSQPEISTITRRDARDTSVAPEEASPDAHSQKRRVDGESEPSLPPTKKRRPVQVEEVESDAEDTDSEEEDAVEEMIIDGLIPGAWTQKKKDLQERTKKERARRREKTAARMNKAAQNIEPKDTSDLSMIDLTLDEPDEVQPNGNSASSQSSTIFSQASTTQSQSSAPTSVFTSTPPTPGHSVPFSFKRSRESLETNGGTSKRMRTRSPSPTFSSRYDPRRRQQQQKARLQRTRQRTPAQRSTQQRAFDDALRATAGTAFFSPFSQSSGQSSSSSRTQSQPAPEIADPISLEEKIRRMAEINAFEEARVAKEMERLKAEQEAEERRRKQEEQRIREKVRLERETREREAELERQKQLRKEEQERRKREQEHEELKRKMQQQHDRWSYGPWTTQRALERYKMLSETFDSMQFSLENPLSFTTVPWPVLHRPTSFTIEDVDWSAVEAFFRAIRTHLRTQDYKALVEKSHRRFHPDRWRARRVLQSVQDEELKACLEVAANTVAQALTPIWRDAKST